MGVFYAVYWIGSSLRSWYSQMAGFFGGKFMGFRRDGKNANYWRKRLEQFPDLLQKVGLPDEVLKDERSLRFFLNEGLFSGGRGSPLVDALEFLSNQQRIALHELLSKVFTEAERSGTIWARLESRFGKMSD